MALFSVFPNEFFDSQSFAWNSLSHSGVYLYNVHSKTKLLVKFLKNVLSVESNEKLQFCKALLAMRDTLNSTYNTLGTLTFFYEISFFNSFCCPVLCIANN